MFAQMKSRRRSSVPSKPCPCGNTCLCHKPRKGISEFQATLMFIGVLGFLFLWGLFMSMALRSPERHVQVDGQDCVIHHVIDSCTSTGACSGHDEAICPGTHVPTR